MQVRVDEIVVRERIRKNLGDLTQLMDSMRVHGQLSPILITPKKVLIAGNRRLEAARMLGWNTIEVKVATGLTEVERLQLEMHENIHRRNFTAEELTEGYSKIQQLQNPSIWKRIWRAIRAFFRRILSLIGIS